MLTNFNIILLTILLLVGLSYFWFKRYSRINIWVTVPDEVITLPGKMFQTNNDISVVTSFIGGETNTVIYEHTTILLDFTNSENNKNLSFIELMRLVKGSEIEPIYNQFYNLMMHIRKPEIIKNVYPMIGDATSVDFTGNYIVTIEYRNKRFQKQYLTVVQSVTTQQE